MNILSGSIGALMMALTGLGAVLCLIWLARVAFMVRWWWGPVVVFVPFGGLIFAITNWQVAKRPFLTGVVLLGLTFGIMACSIQ